MGVMRKTVRDFLEVMEFMIEVVVYDAYGNEMLHENVQSSLFDKDYPVLDKEVFDLLIYRDRVVLWIEE